VGHVPIFGDDLEPFDRLDVADYVVEEDRSVFFYPASESVGFLVRRS